MLWATPAALVALAAALLVACLWWWARSGRERLLAALPGVWMGGAGRPDQLLFVTRDLRGWLQLPGASGRCVFELSAGWGSGWSGEYTLAARGADGGAELAALPVSLGWPGPVLRAAGLALVLGMVALASARLLAVMFMKTVANWPGRGRKAEISKYLSKAALKSSNSTPSPVRARRNWLWRPDAAQEAWVRW